MSTDWPVNATNRGENIGYCQQLRHEIVVNYGTEIRISFRIRRALVNYSDILHRRLLLSRVGFQN